MNRTELNRSDADQPGPVRTVARSYGVCAYCGPGIPVKPGDKLIDGEHDWHADKFRPVAAVTGR